MKPQGLGPVRCALCRDVSAGSGRSGGRRRGRRVWFRPRIGRTLVEICLDLAVAPGFCTGAFWNTLFDSIRLHGGSVATLMQKKLSRQEAFCKEQDRTIGSNWDWQEMGREALRRVLGCFIGEATAEPFGPDMQPSAMAPAVAAGPS